MPSCIYLRGEESRSGPQSIKSYTAFYTLYWVHIVAVGTKLNVLFIHTQRGYVFLCFTLGLYGAKNYTVF